MNREYHSRMRLSRMAKLQVWRTKLQVLIRCRDPCLSDLTYLALRSSIAGSMIKNNSTTAEMNLEALPIEQLSPLEQELVGKNQRYPLPANLRIAKTMYEIGFHFENTVCDRIAQILDDYLHSADINNLAITAVGSSGRFEGSGIEDVELVAFYLDPATAVDISVPQIRGICANLTAIPLTIPLRNGKDMMLGLPVVEEKYVLGNQSVCVHPETKKAYPGRVIEGTLVYGNGDVLIAVKKRAYEEIQTNKQVIDDAKEQQKSFRKAVERGTYRMKVGSVMQDIVQVDLKAQKVLFNPAAKQFGLKYGAIRYIQTRVASQLYNLIRKGKMDAMPFGKGRSHIPLSKLKSVYSSFGFFPVREAPLSWMSGFHHWDHVRMNNVMVRNSIVAE